MNDKRFIFVNQKNLFFCGNQRFIWVTKTAKYGKLYMYHLETSWKNYNIYNVISNGNIIIDQT